MLLIILVVGAAIIAAAGLGMWLHKRLMFIHQQQVQLLEYLEYTFIIIHRLLALKG